MAQYFVSLSGNDSNPGSIDMPFKTVQKAASVAGAGDTVYLRGGTKVEAVYRETVTPACSGTEQQPITYKAFQDEKVCISGTEPISQNSWTQHTASILKTQVPASWILGQDRDRIFLKSRAMKLAMWPKPPAGKSFEEMTWFDYAKSTAGSYDASNVDQNGNILGTYSDPAIQGNWVGGNITFLPGSAWGGQTGKIIASSSGSVSFRFKRQPFQDAYDPVAGNAYFLWGKLDALSQPGEYFIDAATNTVYIWLPKGNPSKLLQSVEIKVRKVGLQLKDRQHIKIEGINLFGCRIEGKNASNIELKGIRCNYPCHDFSSMEHGIWLKGNNNKLLDSDLSNTSGAGVLLDGNNCEIINNVIYNFGYVPMGGEGIETAAGTSNVKVNNNTVFNGCAHGIVMRAKASECKNNRVFRIGLRTVDIRGIEGNQAGDVQGTEIAYNVIHDLPTIYDYFRKYWGANGIGLDAGHPADGVTNYKIHHNVIFRTSSYSISIWPVGPTQANFGNAKNEIFNNSCDAGIYLVRRNDWNPAGTKFYNNICSKFEYGGEAVIHPGGEVNNNILRLAAISGNLQLDPLFVSPNNYNFLLQDGSPAIKAGVAFPATGSSDIGALEKGKDPFIVGASILPEHIQGLKFKVDPANNSRVIIFGLPIGRNLPQGFLLSIEEKIVSSSFYNAVNSDRGITTGIVKIQPGVTGNQRLSISLNGGKNFFSTEKILNFKGFFPVSAGKKPESSNRVVIQGFNFYSLTEHRIPVKLSSVPASGSIEDPILIKVNTQRLVNSGFLKPDCSDLGFFAANKAPIQHWLEDRPNHAETLIWIKLPAEMRAKIQTYEEEPTFFIGCSNPLFSGVSAQTLFPQLAQVTQWLKSHKLSSFNQPISLWPADIGTPAVQPQAGKQPILKANQANGFPALEFDGVDDFCSIGGNFTTSDRGSFFVVHQNPSPGNITHQRLLSASSPGTLDWQVGLQLLPVIESTGVPKASSTPQIAYITVSNPKDLTNMHLGVRHNASWGGNIYKGQVFEVICTNQPLTPQAEMDVREKYLKPKYGIKPLPLPTILYDLVKSPVKVAIEGQNCVVEKVGTNFIEVVSPVTASGNYSVTVTSPDGKSFSVAGGVTI